MSAKEANKMYFVGDYKNPIAVGRKGDIMSVIDSDFFALLDLYRWFRAGLTKIDIDTAPAYQAVGIRAFCEV
jgi:hypothetical protein